MSAALTGTLHLVRLVLRRDRVTLPLWVLGLGGTITSSALAVPAVYDTPEKIATYASAVGTSPVSYLMSGRQVGLDTIGGIVANEISQVAQLGICLMVMFLVVRHTRAEEESGRAELLRSAVVGRHAATAAALLYGTAAALLVGAVTTGSMLAAEVDSTGAMTYGVGLVLLGLCYVAVSLVAAQLSSSARGARGLAGAVIGIGYLVRGLGAMQDVDTLVWASPFGWAQRMDAFGDEQWWPALLLLALTAVLFGLAAWLTAHRDFGSGVLQTRPGRPRASALLGSPLGLALRMQRGLLLGWGVGLSMLGVLYGAVMPTIPDLVSSNPEIAEVIGVGPGAEQALVDAFLRYVFLFMAATATGFAVTSVLRLHSEEEAGRAELVLAHPVRRSAWVGAAVTVAGLGTVVVTLLMGLGLAVGYAVAEGDWSQVAPQVGDQLGYVPAVLVVGAVAVAVVGLRAGSAAVAWVVVAFVLLQVMLGETLRLPDWVQSVSPFWHLPGLPVDSFDLVPVVVELALAAALVALGLWGFRRRDVQAR